MPKVMEKTQNGSVLQQLPLPSTQSNASSSSYGPMQTLLPNSITTGSHNNLSTRNLFPGGNPHVPDQSNWFVSSIPEDAPAARPATSTSALTDDDLFDEPDWVPPIHVQIPADWPPLPDISSSSGSSYLYPDGSTTDEGTVPSSLSHNTSSLQGTLPTCTQPSTLSTSYHSSALAANTEQDTLPRPQ